jgi:hypothetical protein
LATAHSETTRANVAAVLDETDLHDPFVGEVVAVSLSRR